MNLLLFYKKEIKGDRQIISINSFSLKSSPEDPLTFNYADDSEVSIIRSCPTLYRD